MPLAELEQLGRAPHAHAHRVRVTHAARVHVRRQVVAGLLGQPARDQVAVAATDADGGRGGDAGDLEGNVGAALAATDGQHALVGELLLVDVVVRVDDLALELLHARELGQLPRAVRAGAHDDLVELAHERRGVRVLRLRVGAQPVRAHGHARLHHHLVLAVRGAAHGLNAVLEAHVLQQVQVGSHAVQLLRHILVAGPHRGLAVLAVRPVRHAGRHATAGHGGVVVRLGERAAEAPEHLVALELWICACDASAPCITLRVAHSAQTPATHCVALLAQLLHQQQPRDAAADDADMLGALAGVGRA